MSENDDLSDLKQRAEAIGLTRLSDKHLQQLQRATARSRSNKANLQIELTVADEPAHVFSLTEKG
jgi:hypothetical protein